MKRTFAVIFSALIFSLSLSAVAKAKAQRLKTKANSPAGTLETSPAPKPAHVTTFAFIPSLQKGFRPVPYTKSPPALSFAVDSMTLETVTSSQNLLHLNMKSKIDDTKEFNVTINFESDPDGAAALKGAIESGEVRYMSVYYKYEIAYDGGQVTLPKNLSTAETWVLMQKFKSAFGHPEAGFLIDEPLKQALSTVAKPK